MRKWDKISDSAWQVSRLGDSAIGGYNMQEIRWTDLGRKYIIKRGMVSLKPGESYDEGQDKSITGSINKVYTADDQLKF